jgi:hypothetical protein
MPFTIGLPVVNYGEKSMPRFCFAFMQSYNFYTMPTPPVGTLPLDGFLFVLGIVAVWWSYLSMIIIVAVYLSFSTCKWLVHHIAMMSIASTSWKGIVESFGLTFLLVCMHFFHYCFCNKTSKSLW